MSNDRYEHLYHNDDCLDNETTGMNQMKATAKASTLLTGGMGGDNRRLTATIFMFTGLSAAIQLFIKTVMLMSFCRMLFAAMWSMSFDYIRGGAGHYPYRIA